MVFIKDGVGHFAINFLLYIATIKKKYVKMYKKFISQVQMYTNVIRVHSKDYLPISIFLQHNYRKFKKNLESLFRFLTQTMILL